ncbi:MAG: TIGR00730 family Rossman fold protein [Actinomycetota bacterium]
MPDLRRVCVFCASSRGARPDYADAATAVGQLLAAEGIGLVYGGGAVGLMGIVADATLDAGGEVIGIIPDDLFAREVGHAGVTDLRVVGSMHERKQLMFDLSDGFMALPGGLGTLEEMFEVLTWAQLGMHAKPIALLDAGGYYRPLLAFLDRAVDERLITGAHRAMLLEGGDANDLLTAMRKYEPPAVDKWIDREDT